MEEEVEEVVYEMFKMEVDKEQEVHNIELGEL